MALILGMQHLTPERKENKEKEKGRFAGSAMEQGTQGE